MSSCSVLEAFEAAYIMSFLQLDINPADVWLYRPISNLSVVSKLLERSVVRQLPVYLSKPGLLPRLQSAYRARHSTDTDVAIDSRKLPAFGVAGSVSVFDMVDHDS